MQVDSMDDDLRNGLWNSLTSCYLKRIRNYTWVEQNTSVAFLCRTLWETYFKLPFDAIPASTGKIYGWIRNYYFKCEWYEVYDFVEFLANFYEKESVTDMFVTSCNEILEREVSGFRFIGTKLAPITSKEETAEIEEALDSSESLRPVVIHIQTALEKLADRKSPDYRNSIKESISAVEAICRLITGKENATLGQALKVVKGKITMHPALEQAFNKLYGYTSDEDGIRHSLLDEPDIGFEDAKFMLVSCSAFINYLKLKASKVGIQL